MVQIQPALHNHHQGGVKNLLTVNQASLETDTTGWAAGAKCTISRSTAQAAHGSASLLLTSTATGTISALTPTGASGVVVIPGVAYTVAYSCYSAVAARTSYVTLTWYDSAAAAIGSPDQSATIVPSTTWTQNTMTVVSPATAAFVSVRQYFGGVAATDELFYVDKVGLWLGASTVWHSPV